jgi:hypothetical protein
MKKLLALIPILLMATTALACGDFGTLNLVQKDPSTWATVQGATGTFQYWTDTSFNIVKTCVDKTKNVCDWQKACTTKTRIVCDWEKVGGVWRNVCSPVQYQNCDWWKQVCAPVTYQDCDYSKVKVETPKFDFDGKNLQPNTQYSLISYAEPYPGTGCVLLGTGTADANGKVDIDGVMQPLVYNTYTSGEYAGQTGAKIWLVPSSDVTCPAGFSAWNPTTYLFETKLLKQ